MRNFWALVFGSAIGTVAFFLTLLVLANHAPDAVLRAVRIILLAEPSDLDSLSSAAAVSILQQNGLGISADSYLGRITDFYAVVLQIAFAAFVLFGVVSFFAIRWQSNQLLRI